MVGKKNGGNKKQNERRRYAQERDFFIIPTDGLITWSLSYLKSKKNHKEKYIPVHNKSPIFLKMACTIYQQIIRTMVYIIPKRRENLDWTQLLSNFYFFEQMKVEDEDRERTKKKKQGRNKIDARG